jgi:hypothetical protein
MPNTMFLSSVLAFWPLFSPFALLGFGFANRRARELTKFSGQFGLEFAPTDPFGLIDHTFHVFNLADRVRVGNVVWGDWRGVQVKAADLWYSGRPSNADRDGPSWPSLLYGRTNPLTFAVVESEAFLPDIWIRRRNGLREIGSRLEFGTIRFESEEFNRKYEVICEDREFAFRFIDARMMQFLLDVSDGLNLSFEANGSKLLVYCRRPRGIRMAGLLRAARDFRLHVPQMVLREYGPNSATA